MTSYALIFSFGCVSLALFFCLWRLIIGPSVADRIIAIDTMVINAIALVILYGIYYQTTIYFESALLFAMFGFVATVAYCRFLLRGDVIE
jgi:multicomponent K+:H+ antiporter subunit F